MNKNSATSRTIGDYYVHARQIPLANICRLRASEAEQIARTDYDRDIAVPIAAFLRARHLQDTILYIVTTTGVPLRIAGEGAELTTGAASVDSELSLLYSDMRTPGRQPKGYVPNPFLGKLTARFTHPEFPMYLVTRLTGYDFPDVKAMIDRGLAARNRGKFVIDLESSTDKPGNDWLRQAARALPRDRVILDESDKVLLNQTDVIGYAGWGSNDKHRTARHLGFHWLPGAIVTEFVSTNARTFARPPESWNIGNWNDPKTWFAGSPQTMTADYIHDGATGASGHVVEPYLQFTPRPDFVLPAYYSGRNLAESFYLGIPALSWMNIVVGDPLCTIGKPSQ